MTRKHASPATYGIDPAFGDAGSLHPVFTRFGRVHLPGFLLEPGPLDLVSALESSEGWVVSTMGGGSTVDFPASTFMEADVATQETLLRSAHAEAQGGFHYLFESLRISDLVEQGQPVAIALEGFYRWLNSDVFLGFARDISGHDDLDYVDAQATRYRPGHYLNEHDDEKPGAGRRLAYVLNLSPGWRASWGGQLAFLDPDQHVSEAYTPAFNALNLFRVPQPHMVTQVAAFAGASRLSITGWIRSSR
ncbi:2OG-Fe(II) oxygenase family protein [uncultured Brevundimonas sp.]|uniref:2OG-Fe(II) oxygenase n=1 Tax=uncultured Brevundimonas sp. TaxID=213418 RepID=UPI002620D816|nr:2OG-Fe(II) oxygenase family protein [uncultured Brevundimonas sp.]